MSETIDIEQLPKKVGRPKKVVEEAMSPQPEPIPAGFVKVRVLKLGDGKISDGKITWPISFHTGRYARNDEFVCPAETAAALEARGYAETI